MTSLPVGTRIGRGEPAAYRDTSPPSPVCARPRLAVAPVDDDVLMPQRNPEQQVRRETAATTRAGDGPT